MRVEELAIVRHARVRMGDETSQLPVLEVDEIFTALMRMAYEASERGDAVEREHRFRNGTSPPAVWPAR